MGCERYHDAISARNDGETPGVPDDELDAHLSTCADCRSYDMSSMDLRRSLSVYDVADVPDVSREVVRRSAAADRRASVRVVRWLLSVVAVLLIVLSVPEFLSNDPDGHGLSHLGAFRLAYAIGLLTVVIRPARARTLLHVAVVLVIALAATATVDVVRGRVPLLHETVHLLGLSSALLLWMLARHRPSDPGPAPATSPGHVPASRRLKVVRSPGSEGDVGEGATGDRGTGDRSASQDEGH